MEQHKQGWLWQEKVSSHTIVLTILYGLLSLVTAVCFIYALVTFILPWLFETIGSSGSFENIPNEDIPNSVVMGGLILALFVMFYRAFHHSLTYYHYAKLFKPAQVMLDQAIYQLGDTVKIAFSKSLQSKTLAKDTTLVARLACFEIVEREVGTIVNYEHIIFWSSPIQRGLIPKDHNKLRYDFTFESPNDITVPSQRAHRTNKVKEIPEIVWVVEIYSKVKGHKIHFHVPVNMDGVFLPKKNI